ncbi:hypothetical protein PTSG_11524, partial [Salpingoeca rosetta]
MLLQQQCTVPTTCAGLTSYLACTATLNCQSDPAVSQVIADLRECFGTAGSDNGNGAPQMWTTNGTLYLQAGNDIVFQTKTASSNNNDHPVSVTDIKGVLSTLPTLALKGDVQRVNDTVSDVEGALRTEISTTSEVVTDALVPRFSSMEAAIARSFAAINASLAATWSSLDGVNASLTDSIQDVQRHVNRAAAEASTAVGGVDDDDEDGDTNDGSSSLTHGSAVAFQGNPLKALLARRKQTSIDGNVDGTPLEELMMSVGLHDEEEEEDDPFAEMTREQVFVELRSWRERCGTEGEGNSGIELTRGGAAGQVQHHFSKDETVTAVPAPVKVFGDIHGQLHDMLAFFRIYGVPHTVHGDIHYISYLFIVGDFVDRGSHSLEVRCCCLLLLLLL